jgi:putative DNA primase/helicase
MQKNRAGSLKPAPSPNRTDQHHDAPSENDASSGNKAADSADARPVGSAMIPQVGLGDALYLPRPRFAERRPEMPVTKPSARAYRQNDEGNAERFAEMFCDQVMYVAQWKRWHVWDGARWEYDRSGGVRRLMLNGLARARANTKGLSEDDAKKFRNFLSASEDNKNIKAALEAASVNRLLYVLPEELDSDPWLLNVMNGTIDLRTGRLRKHNPSDGITKLVPHGYYPDAEYPTFDAYIKRAMQGSDEMVRYLQRCVGYSLTGIVSEKAFFLLYGPTDTGKTRLVTMLHDLMGPDYSTKIPTSTLTVKRYAGVPNDLAKLKGARLASADEFGENQRLDVELVKKLIGGTGQLITARFMRADFFDFLPEFALWVDTNEKPTIKELDSAIYNRMHPIPFLVQIPKRPVEEGGQDKFLSEKLRDEMAGILRWAVEGCLMWQEEGLNPPDEVLLARAEYEHEENELAQFHEEYYRKVGEGRADKGRMFKLYCRWRTTTPSRRKRSTR